MPVKVELPSGIAVTIADRNKGSLAGKVTGSVMIESQDGRVLIPGDIGIRQTDAFLAQTIEEWSGPGLEGVPIPKMHGDRGADLIGEVLDEDDYTALHDAVQARVVKLVGRGRGNPRSTPAALPSSSPS